MKRGSTERRSAASKKMWAQMTPSQHTDRIRKMIEGKLNKKKLRKRAKSRVLQDVDSPALTNILSRIKAQPKALLYVLF